MGWEDRDYHKDTPSGGGGGGFGGGGMAGGLFAVLNWSFPIGTIFDVHVRVHFTWVMLAFFELFTSHFKGIAALWIGVLFVSVLLHEFGHVFACRRVGGTANEILMWPLGGLAFVAPPRRPWAEFWTTFWGPAVSALLALAAYAFLGFRLGFDVVSLNPWAMLTGQNSLFLIFFEIPWIDRIALIFFNANYVLLLFNLLLLFYPFDGGRLFQEVLWMWIGYARSMWWSMRVGMGVAVVAGIYGLWLTQLTLFVIAVMGFLQCFQQIQMLKYEGADEPYESLYYRPTQSRRGWLSKWRTKRAQTRTLAAEREDARLQAEVDRILDKVRDHGLHSLSRSEKKILQRATERQRRAG